MELLQVTGAASENPAGEDFGNPQWLKPPKMPKAASSTDGTFLGPVFAIPRFLQGPMYALHSYMDLLGIVNRPQTYDNLVTR